MLPRSDPEALRRYVIEASRTIGLPLQESWQLSVVEHLSRLLAAAEIVDAWPHDLPEPVTTFDP
jgi:hypothetical protein